MREARLPCLMTVERLSLVSPTYSNPTQQVLDSRLRGNSACLDLLIPSERNSLQPNPMRSRVDPRPAFHCEQSADLRRQFGHYMKTKA